MKKRKLGKTDMMVSVIGFGGIPIQRLNTKDAEKVLHGALDNGINFIDSARGYTDSEVKVGAALKSKRQQCYLASKSMAHGFFQMQRDIELSLRHFQTDVIDLYQVHNPPNLESLDTIMGPRGAFEALVAAKQAGKVRHIGITGHSVAVILKAVETDQFATVQHAYNPMETTWQEAVMPSARQKNMGLIGMKPVCGGALRNVPAGLRFALMENGVDVVIPGMDSLDQVLENCAVGQSLRSLDAGDWTAIEADKKVWKGNFCRRCGYCLPCKEQLNIPFLLLIEAYYSRYDLKEWALERLAGLDKTFGDCTACGNCVKRCPYDLPIPELMAKAAKNVC